MANALKPRDVVTAVVTASGTLAPNSHTRVNATAGNVVMALPTTNLLEGVVVSVERDDGSTNTLTITGNIRGVSGAALKLELQRETIELVYDAGASTWGVTDRLPLTSLDARYPTNAGFTPTTPGLYTLLVYDAPLTTSPRPTEVPATARLRWRTTGFPPAAIDGDETYLKA